MADNRVWFRGAALCLLLTGVAAVADAQDVASSFKQLRSFLKPGDVVTVTDTTGCASRNHLHEVKHFRDEGDACPLLTSRHTGILMSLWF